MAEIRTREISVIRVRETVQDLEKHDLTDTHEKHFATESDIRAMEARTDAGFAEVNPGVAECLTHMDVKFAELRTDLLKWFIVAYLAQAALIIAAIKYLS